MDSINWARKKVKQLVAVTKTDLDLSSGHDPRDKLVNPYQKEELRLRMIKIAQAAEVKSMKRQIEREPRNMVRNRENDLQMQMFAEILAKELEKQLKQRKLDEK